MVKKIFLLVCAAVMLTIFLSSCNKSSEKSGGLKNFDEGIFVTEIEILNEDLKDHETWGKYVVIRKNENGEWLYQIECRVYPDDATNKKVKFIYDQQSKATVTDDGIVTFSEPDMVTVEIVPLDGSDVSAKITIIAR